MEDILTVAIFLVAAPFVGADECFYDDGSRFGKLVLCEGGCCGTGENPCCTDSSSIMAITTGVIICILIVLVCVAACCIHSFKSKGTTVLAGPRAPEIRSVSNEFHEFNTFANGQVATPPRYSDIYPQGITATPASIDRTRTRSNSNRSTNSINRNSSTRRGIRRNPSTQSRNVDPSLSNTGADSTQKHERRNSDQSTGITESTKKQTVTNTQGQANNDLTLNVSNLNRKDVDLNNDRSSFMVSITDQLPSVFYNRKVDE